jgi:secreted Zn-dependent insulinase-like peptidase
MQAAQEVTAATLEAFIPRLLKDIHVVALAHGNLTPSGVEAVSKLLQDRLLAHAGAVEVPAAEVVNLPDGEQFLRRLDIDHNDSAVAVYVQGSGTAYQDRAAFHLLGQIMESAFYHELRTVRQLGYVVFASALPVMEVPGLVFVVQSPRTSADDLVLEIEGFIERFAERLDELTADELESYKQGLLVQILQTDQRLKQRSDRYWSEIDDREYAFDSREKLAAAVSEIDIARLRDFYRSTLLERPRSRLVVSSNGAAFKREVADEPATPAQRIGDTSEFKRRQPHFPPS